MTDEEIGFRLASGEDSQTQFKRGPIGVAKLAAELTAFTNAEGGVIFFGVNDDGSVAGLDAAQKKQLNDELSNAANDNVRPSVYPRTEYHLIDGRLILAVIVSEGVSKPYADKTGSFWTKSGPDKRRITAREELQRLLQSSLLIHADELPVPKTSIEDVDPYHFGEFLENNYGISKADVLTPGKVDIPQKLQNLGLMDGTQLTLAGLLLFGKDPQRYSPVNMVKAVTFVGTSMAGSEYRDSDDLRGTLRDLYKSTMQFILRNLRHVQAGQNFNSIGKLEIPEGALQELVVNMFLHRDYFVSSPWRVMIFDDRIELVSPGCLPNHLDIEKIKLGVSVARNPLIFSFATKEMPYRGLGTGIQRAMELGAKMEFVSDREQNVFKAIVYPSVNPSINVNLPVNLPVNGNLPENLPVNPSVNPSINGNLPVNPSVNPSINGNLPKNPSINPSVNENLPENLVELLSYLTAHPTATYDEMAKCFSKNRDTIRVYMNQLKNPPYSLVRRVGSRKTGHWEIVKRD